MLAGLQIAQFVQMGRREHVVGLACRLAVQPYLAEPHDSFQVEAVEAGFLGADGEFFLIPHATDVFVAAGHHAEVGILGIIVERLRAEDGTENGPGVADAGVVGGAGQGYRVTETLGEPLLRFAHRERIEPVGPFSRQRTEAVGFCGEHASGSEHQEQDGFCFHSRKKQVLLMIWKK